MIRTLSGLLTVGIISSSLIAFGQGAQRGNPTLTIDQLLSATTISIVPINNNEPLVAQTAVDIHDSYGRDTSSDIAEALCAKTGHHVAYFDTTTIYPKGDELKNGVVISNRLSENGPMVFTETTVAKISTYWNSWRSGIQGEYKIFKTINNKPSLW